MSGVSLEADRKSSAGTIPWHAVALNRPVHSSGWENDALSMTAWN